LILNHHRIRIFLIPILIPDSYWDQHINISANQPILKLANSHIPTFPHFGTAYLRLGRKLEEGFVITNEPGLYFIPALIDKWQQEGINSDFIDFNKVNKYRDFGGVRLEDDLLITAEGSRNLGKERIPVEVAEIEKLVGKLWDE